MVMRGKRPFRNLSAADKVRAIERIRNGETKASVSRSIGVPESTIRGWCKNEGKLRYMSGQLSSNNCEENIQENLCFSNENTISPPEKRIHRQDSPVPSTSSETASSISNNDHLASNTYFEKIANLNETVVKSNNSNQASQHGPTSRSPLQTINPNSWMFWSSASALSPEYSQLSMMQNLYLYALMFPTNDKDLKN